MVFKCALCFDLIALNSIVRESVHAYATWNMISAKNIKENEVNTAKLQA